MGVSPTTALGAWVREGRFTPASREECLAEERCLIELLEVPLRFEGFHFDYDRDKVSCPEFTDNAFEFNDLVTNWTHTRGLLPDDRVRLMKELELAS